MFTPRKSADPFDLTMLSTPQPQATSTVQRKSTLEGKYLGNENERPRRRTSPPYKGDGSHQNDESSLGILDNISSFLAEVSEMSDSDRQEQHKFDIQREAARQLLQRCSDFNSKSIMFDSNKENNVNIQNTSKTSGASFLKSGQSFNSNAALSENESTLRRSPNQGSTASASVIFEPNEITARSSGLSRSSEKCASSLSGKNMNAISFDTTTAELMAQFNNEEFKPASEMASQMLADEASWQQNYSYALPTTSPEKEYLDLSCFSGIIGELDLSVESCAGHKISVEEFFRRKCGNIGELSGEAIERPSFGLSVSSPKKKEKPTPLIDTTMMTEASSIASSIQKDKPQPVASNVSKDIEEQSIMSLTDIAQALQDIDSGTPRRLVDQLIMAKKKKKPTLLKDDGATRDTYTLIPTDRKSMLATPTLKKYDQDIGILNLSAKLSLDSKKINETLDTKQKTPRMLSFKSEAEARKKESIMSSLEDHNLKKEQTNGSIATPYNQSIDLKLHDTTNTNLPSRLSFKQYAQHIHEKENLEALTNQDTEFRRGIKVENISHKSQSDSIVRDNLSLHEQTRFNRDIVIIESTDDFCKCLVGVPRETDIELLNKSDRWITCTVSVQQMQVPKQNVILTIPSDTILIKPSNEQSIKIGVKILKMSKPFLVILNIAALDMVTKFEWTMEHVIRLKPEELNVQISGVSETDTLDFQSLLENNSIVAPIIIENKNSMEIPIKLSILQDRPTVFSMDEMQEQKRVILKSQDAVPVTIQCRGILYENLSEMQQRRSHRYEAKLMIQLESDINDAITMKEVSLAVQVTSCKIQVVDTEVPVLMSHKESKPFSIINLGSTSVTICASIVQDQESSKTARDFTVQPQKLVLQPEKIGCFFIMYKPQLQDATKKHVQLKLAVGGNTFYYSVIGERCSTPEPDNENFLRCETPQHFASVSSPTSPHSVTSNRSGISGRNSPSGSVSGSTVVGDKIPIRATHAALIWNSVKAGKSDVKEFTILNTSNNKIKIQALILNNDKSFRFLRDRQSVGTSLVLVLQRSQSKTLSVVFSPHCVGAVKGKIIFRHYEPKREETESRPSKLILLFGYGGYGKVEISEVCKDISGKMWLSLGTFNSEGSLRTRIKLQNAGDLCSFAKIKLTPKAMCPTMLSRWHVSPTELLLNPKESQWVSLEFRPRKEDLMSLKSADVSHVGTLSVIHGDEPTRLRIRRLYNRLKETGELSGSENEAFKDMAHLICTAFPEEQMMPELNSISDSVQNLGDLCQAVRQHEIMMTVEMSADETLSLLQDSADDSQMFYSLCSDNSHIYEGAGESFLPSVTMGGHDLFQNEIGDNILTVSPTMVALNPPLRTVTCVMIKSSCRVAQSFETTLSDNEYLSVLPSEGMIPAGRDFQLKIACKQKVERSFRAVLEIYTINNKQDVEIRVNVKRL